MVESIRSSLATLLYHHYDLAKWDKSIELSRQFHRMLDVQSASLLPDDLRSTVAMLEESKEKLEAIEGDY